LEVRDHPRTPEFLDVIAEAGAVGGLVVERIDVLAFQDTGEINISEGIGLPRLEGVGDFGRLRERRRLWAILGFEDGEEVRESFAISGDVVGCC
jgi:hypothetical protein